MIARLALLAASLVLLAAGAALAETWKLDVWEPPFRYEGRPRSLDYQPLDKAERPWRLCASYPHLKDSYWLSVNYGMVEQARQLGIRLEVVEAGGYPNLTRQRQQIADCVAAGAEALIVGTVSFDGLSDLMVELSQSIPIVAAVNDIADDGISAKAGVSWTEMGYAIGRYFALRHPAGSQPVKLAWFPGPKGAGWVRFVETGFAEGLKGSAAEIVVTKFGDTGTEIQLILIEEALEEHPEIDYIVGSAVTAEAAVSVLRARGLTEEIAVLADYFTHGVFRGIKRGKILAAPTDSPVMQGRIAIDQAVRLLEGKLVVRHAGPRIIVIDAESIDALALEDSLAPAWFNPVFVVEP
ncbi:MAG TPA: TMAO reductase system periplasmic protein TorT [Kiloniellales bacterium]|nr:TMAO reductase system periplasmic protein TorT [Kiloniellales bacterium]